MELLHYASIAGKYSLVAAVSYLLLIATYRILLHPLSRYPGPLSAKLSNLYGGIHSVTKRYHLETWQNHQKYGPVVRQGPSRLVFNSVNAMQDIYSTTRLTKSYAYAKSRIAPSATLFDTIETDKHRQRRKVMSQAITEKSMREFEPVMLGQIDIFLRRLLRSAKSGEPVNLSDCCQRLGVDVVGLLAFGYELKLLTEDTYQIIPGSMAFVNSRINLYLQLPEISFIEPYMKMIGAKQREKFTGVGQNMIRTRLGKGTHAQRDLYSFVHESIEGDGEQLMGTELWADSMFFLTAGGTTTATTMSSVFWYLLRNPDWQEKLVHEIRSTFETAEDIRSGPKLLSCKYLRAIIDESLRLSPPSLAILWREQAYDDPKRGEPLIIDGHVIPPGTEVGVSLYSLMHNEEYFPDPFAFKPDRWLAPEDPNESDSSKAARELAHRAFTPFSLGARGCPGKAMAYMEDGLGIAKTLWYFDMSRAPGKLGEIGGGRAGDKQGRHRVDEYQLYDNVTASHDGPYALLRVRGDLSKDLVI
ncbi:cytochrome P450 [Xylariaceae sp. FL1019]|nr:cytochrome P450 [Xylariaceae sp. FL1019]